MSNIRSCGAPKPFDKLICDPCVCDGYGDVQIVAKNAIRTIRALELMKNDVKVIKTEPLLKLLKGENDENKSSVSTSKGRSTIS